MKKGIENSKNKMVKQVIGENISKARNELKLSREEFCKILCNLENAPKSEDGIATLDPNTFKQWEYGTNAINIEWIPAICTLLKCDTDYLFGRIDGTGKNRDEAFIHEETGLCLDTIRSLKEIKEEEIESVQKAVSTFLNDITDNSIYFLTLATSYMRFLKGDYDQSFSYYVLDNKGNAVDFFKANEIAEQILQRAFTRIIFCPTYEKQELSRANSRRERARMTENEISEFVNSQAHFIREFAHMPINKKNRPQ